VVIFSLGNFISNQRDQPRDIGGILSVKISKQNGTATIGDVSFIATYVHRYENSNGRVYNVLPMADIIKNRNYPPFKAADYVNIEARYQEMMGHVIAEP
jgi:poly-gamma-glutamate synthesis protein (capsule biosynthesis protein)